MGLDRVKNKQRFHPTAPAVIQPEPRPYRNPTTSQSVSANRFLAAILTRLRLLCRAEIRCFSQSFALRSRHPGLAKERFGRSLPEEAVSRAFCLWRELP